jgi:hypothetical protein
MIIGMTIGGAVLGAIGGGLLWNQKRLENKANQIKYFDRMDLGTALDTYKHVSGQLGQGAFTQMLKLNARAVLTPPLKGEFSGADVVYYHAKVVREYEVKEKNKDSQGKVTERWVSKTETIKDGKHGETFELNDGKGTATIRIAGADLRPTKGHNSFDNVKDQGFNLSNIIQGALSFADSNTSRTKGFRKTEEHIKVGQDLFILGEMHDRNGSLEITRPKEKDVPFIISVQNEDEVLRGIGGSAKTSKIVGYILIGIGVAVLAAGFFMKS